MRRDKDRLQDILNAISQIEKYTKHGYDIFHQNELIQIWVIHHLQIIGEAAGRISEITRVRKPDLPWPQIVAMRNILVHEYFGIDLEEIWSTVERELPRLRRDIEQLLQLTNNVGETK